MSSLNTSLKAIMKTLLNIGFLLSILLAICHALDYSDLQDTGIFCPSRDSCEHAIDENVREMTCACDKLCSFHQDCCIDSPYFRATNLHRARRTRKICMGYGDKPNVGAYVMGNCPHSYRGPQIISSMCEGEDDLHDPIFSVPVTDTTSNITFRNRYCAECNGVSNSTLKSWLIALQFKSDLSYDPHEIFASHSLKFDLHHKRWGVWLGGRFHSCNLSFHLPNYISGVRQCRSGVVSTCPSGWSGYSVRRACLAYQGIVYTRENVYRNVHCAICNGVDLKTVSCAGSPIFSEKRAQISFPALLDVNFYYNNEVGKLPSTTTPIPIAKICNSDEIYDPFSYKCRRIVCALPGYTLVDRKCKKI